MQNRFKVRYYILSMIQRESIVQKLLQVQYSKFSMMQMFSCSSMMLVPDFYDPFVRCLTLIFIGHDGTMMQQ